MCGTVGLRGRRSCEKSSERCRGEILVAKYLTIPREASASPRTIASERDEMRQNETVSRSAEMRRSRSAAAVFISSARLVALHGVAFSGVALAGVALGQPERQKMPQEGLLRAFMGVSSHSIEIGAVEAIFCASPCWTDFGEPVASEIAAAP